MNTSAPTPFTVVHSLPVWLPLTSPWLFNHVRYLPPNIESQIVCERTDNLEQFTIPNIYSLDTAPRLRFFWDKGLRKLGIRQHLGYLVEIAKRKNASIIHSHWGDVAWNDMDAVQQVGACHVVTFYGKDVNYLPRYQPKWLARYKELFERVSLVLCEGPHMADCIVKMGCPENKVCVQHLGVEIDKVHFRPRSWTPAEPIRVLIAASFREKKGIPYALEALGLLQSEVRLEITVIGDASQDLRSQPEKEKILNVIEKYGLRSKTRLLGYQPYAVLIDEAYKHHIFLSPSVTSSDGDTEGGAPVTLIDMAATGMPIISTTHCDIPSVILHKKSGLLAEERNIVSLLEHLRWLIGHPERWASMLAEGRKHIEENFDAIKQGNKMHDIYRKLMNNRCA